MNKICFQFSGLISNKSWILRYITAVFLNLFLYAEPFWPTKTSAEPLCYTKIVCGTPKVLSSVLITVIHCFNAFLSKLANGKGIMTQISIENVEKESISVETKIFSKVGCIFKFGGTLGRPHGTPVEKHWSRVSTKCQYPKLRPSRHILTFQYQILTLVILS